MSTDPYRCRLNFLFQNLNETTAFNVSQQLVNLTTNVNRLRADDVALTSVILEKFGDIPRRLNEVRINDINSSVKRSPFCAKNLLYPGDNELKHFVSG